MRELLESISIYPWSFIGVSFVMLFALYMVCETAGYFAKRK